MNEITEDYVSYEVAKLLKEKGFNESCYTYYDDIDDTINRFDKGYHFNNTSYPWGVPYDVNKAKKYVVAPTLQMAMKWLRRIHNVNIDIVSIWNQKRFEYQVFVVTPKNAKHCYVDNKLYLGYEEATEAGLKYALKNLT